MGPSSVPARHDAAQAVESLVSSGFDACELDFEGGFWLGEPEAEALGRAAISADIALSLHAPLPAFMGHVERGQKTQGVGMLDQSAHLARLVGPRWGSSTGLPAGTTAGRGAPGGGEQLRAWPSGWRRTAS